MVLVSIRTTVTTLVISTDVKMRAETPWKPQNLENPKNLGLADNL